MPTNRIAPAPTRRRAEPFVLTLQVASRAAHVPGRRKLRRWVAAALAKRARLTVRLVDGHEGRSLNRRYRGRDRATNVLTFVYDGLSPLTGDIALCAPVIEREARARALDLEAHYAHLVVHGVLHLQGFDHMRPREARRMQARETGILRGLGYPDPWAEAPHA